MDPRGRLTTTADWRRSHPSLSLTGYSEREPAKTNIDVIDQLIKPSWCWWNIYHQIAKYTFIFICIIFIKQDHIQASNISPQIQETKTCSKDYNSQTLAELNQKWPTGRGRGRIIAAVRDTFNSICRLAVCKRLRMDFTVTNNLWPQRESLKKRWFQGEGKWAYSSSECGESSQKSMWCGTHFCMLWICFTTLINKEAELANSQAE